MLPLFEGDGELKTNVLNFEDELKVNEALTLEHLRALSRFVTYSLYPARTQ